VRSSSAASAALHWGAAALAAAALITVPWLVIAAFDGAVHGWWIAVLAVCAATLVVHVRLQPEHASRAALWLVLTEATLIVGMVGLLAEKLGTDSCGGGLAANLVEWIGGSAIYLSGGAWALQRPLRGLWALPLATVVAGAWMAAAAHLVPGGAGACFN
jgi:hypothetical protein